jgi:Skp family chaperone for outer membrane proteins
VQGLPTMKKTTLSYSLLVSSICLGMVAAPTNKGPKMSKSPKVAIIDMRTIFSQDPMVLKDDSKISHEWRTLYNKLESTMRAPQQELQEIQAQLQTKGKEFEALQKSGISSRDMLLKKYQDEIAPLENKLQVQSQQLQRFANDELMKIQSTVGPKVQKAVDDICNSQGWDFAITRDVVISTPAENSEFDITSDVLTKINTQYAATKQSSGTKA